MGSIGLKFSQAEHAGLAWKNSETQFNPADVNPYCDSYKPEYYSLNPIIIIIIIIFETWMIGNLKLHQLLHIILFCFQNYVFNFHLIIFFFLKSANSTLVYIPRLTAIDSTKIFHILII